MHSCVKSQLARISHGFHWDRNVVAGFSPRSAPASERGLKAATTSPEERLLHLVSSGEHHGEHHRG